MKLYYLPLEPYQERYTYQQGTWTVARWKDQCDLIVVEGQPLSDEVRSSVVLDPHGRSHFALTQMAQLVSLFNATPPSREDIVYLADMFHPGYECLPYIFEQLPAEQRPKVFAFCHAQSVDPQDFTFPMRRWMRHYELMVDETITGIFVAATCLKEMLRAALLDCPIHKVGHAFDVEEVLARAGAVPNWNDRCLRVVYTSRWDKEKQPHFFMDLVERAKASWGPDAEFTVCTGAMSLRSNDPTAVERARKMEAEGKLEILTSLTKEAYYRVLKQSKVHFNCALQDFVSYTLLEASALGTPSLLPAYMSFPEAVHNDHRRLYTPWSMHDADEKLRALLLGPPLDEVSDIAWEHHLALDRMLETMKAV